MTSSEAHYQVVRLNHANLKREVCVIAGVINMYHWSEASKSVNVYLSGGQVIPVTESIEELDQKIKALREAGGQ